MSCRYKITFIFAQGMSIKLTIIVNRHSMSYFIVIWNHIIRQCNYKFFVDTLKSIPFVFDALAENDVSCCFCF